LKHVILVLMVIALVSCASPKIQSLSELEEVAPVETVETTVEIPVQIVETVTEQTEEIAEPAKEVIAVNPKQEVAEEQPVVEEPVIEEIATETSASAQEPVEEFTVQPALVPITQHYVINQQDIYVSAYIGEATISYPEAWNSSVVDEVIAYLANKYPIETKDITFVHEDNTLTFFYPTSWGEAEFNYAVNILSKELSEVEQPKAQTSWQVIRLVRILDEEEPETNEIITYTPVAEIHPETDVELIAAPDIEEPNYIDNWWEDPIYKAPEATETVAEVTEPVVETTEPAIETPPVVIYDEIVTELAKPEEVAEEPAVEPAKELPTTEEEIVIIDEDTTAKTSWKESVAPYIETLKPILPICIALLMLLILWDIIRKKNNKK
jgi:uncharacterized protein YlxP (DUF503 family)